MSTGIGTIESNGHENYENWNTMMDFHPRKEAPWVKAKNGVYESGDEFYRNTAFSIRYRITKRCLDYIRAEL